MKTDMEQTTDSGKAGRRSKLVVVADLGRFKVYRLDDRPQFSHPQLTLIEDWETEVAHHLSEDVTDQAGRFAKVPTVAGARSDGEEHHLDLERQRRATKTLGKRLNELINPKQVEACYFAADSRINKAILEGLDQNARNKIQTNVAANLTKLGTAELLRQFRP